MVVMSSVSVPPLASRTCCRELVVPRACGAKVTLEGARIRTGVTAKLIFATKASKIQPALAKVVWKAPGVVGKSEESVEPVT